MTSGLGIFYLTLLETHILPHANQKSRMCKEDCGRHLRDFGTQIPVIFSASDQCHLFDCIWKKKKKAFNILKARK